MDEIDKAQPNICRIICDAMQYRMSITIGKGISARISMIELPRFTLIGTTTQVDRIPEELRYKFGITAPILGLSKEEMIQLLREESKTDNIRIDEDAIITIVGRSRKNMRSARHLLKRVKDYALVYGEHAITESFVERVLTMIE